MFYFNFKHITTVFAKIKVILISIKTYGQIAFVCVSIGMSSMQFKKVSNKFRLYHEALKSER